MKNEAKEFWKNPIKATPELQEKYIGCKYEDYSEPKSQSLEDLPEDERWKYYEYSYSYTNPFTGESNMITSISPKPPKTKEEIIENFIKKNEPIKEIKLTKKEIGDIIIKKNYEDNINAQLADLAKTNLKLIALLSKTLPKEQIKVVFSEEIEKIKEVSQTRVECGLSPFDISFLD